MSSTLNFRVPTGCNRNQVFGRTLVLSISVTPRVGFVQKDSALLAV